MLLLMILDGYGIAPPGDGNAVWLANKPNLDKLFSDYPHTQLGASGKAVGLPEGQMGNSEVGHLNLGAGRIVYQDITRIDQAIADGEFFRNGVLNDGLNQAAANGRNVHLLGLVSDGENTVVLTDILGDEDHYGDMDFKVTGSRNGITALQMDIKIEGITREVMQKALEQAKEGRLFILEKMSESPAPLYVIFVDHGSENAFYVYSGFYDDSRYIEPAELARHFDTLQAGLSVTASRTSSSTLSESR